MSYSCEGNRAPDARLTSPFLNPLPHSCSWPNVLPELMASRLMATPSTLGAQTPVPIRPHPFRRLRFLAASTLAASALVCAVACSPEEDEPTPTLPPDTTTPTAAPTAPPVLDDGSSEPSNPAPVDTLRQLDEGTWLMSPTGGPYSDVSGSLLVSEYLNGSENPTACQLEYALTGYKVTPGCPDCNYTFRIKHVLLSGDPEDCSRDDLPEDGQYLVLGYSSETHLVYYDYHDTGTWLPWYEGSRTGDEILYSWEVERGTTQDN